MYKLSGVTKNYTKGRSTVAALRGIDLVIEDGEWLAVQGPTGGGKSTLLQILGGLDRPSSGIVEFDGRLNFKQSRQGQAARVQAVRTGPAGRTGADAATSPVPGLIPADVPSPGVQAGPARASDLEPPDLEPPDLEADDLSELEDDDSEPADTVSFD
jgi:energy-coupling factor transporter ATP-binding protein EcfA2